MLPAITNTDLLPFNYEGMKLQEACWISGNPYFTRKAIGEFLEYPSPQKAIDRIIQRNPYISDKRWSTVTKMVSVDEYPKGHSHVKLTCESTTRTREIVIEVYNPIGLQLIVFESRQPKAIQYKIAVAHLVYAFMKGEIKPSKWTLKGDRVSAIRQIMSHPPTQKRHGLIADLALRESVSEQTIYRWIDAAGGIRTHQGTKKHRNTKGNTGYPEEKQKVLAYVRAHPEYMDRSSGNRFKTHKRKDLKTLLGLKVTVSTVNSWIRYHYLSRVKLII